jgi:hypothetical protein
MDGSHSIMWLYQLVLKRNILYHKYGFETISKGLGVSLYVSFVSSIIRFLF